MLIPDPADPWPAGSASLLLPFAPLPSSPVVPAWVGLPVMHEASGCSGAPACSARSLAGRCAVGSEAEALRPGPPPCTAALLHLDAAAELLPRGQVLGWSTSRAGRQPSPAVHRDLVPRNLREHMLLKSPRSALPQLKATLSFSLG